MFIECQVCDWRNHKTNCKTLKDGTWRTIKLSVCLPGHENKYLASINHQASITSPKTSIKKTDPNMPPPNIHGTRTFLIKIQLAITTGLFSDEDTTPQHMLIYDGKRSVQEYFVQGDDNFAVFEELKHEMEMTSVGPPGALKVYRYARRVSDWELNVCLDKPPQTIIKW